MNPVILRAEQHFGVERLYFENDRHQERYGNATGRTLVTESMIDFLKGFGLEVVRPTD